ncbi:MAG: hypothetical protein EOP86_20165 [Verrucomicrobiaceae bacterium]|nr:MAG: hypothetical protein EOP86_20165 [Verrucomicrobiaceae bacterium]
MIKRLLFLVFFLAQIAEVSAAITAFSFTSSPNSYVGGGETYTIFGDNPNFEISLNVGTQSYFYLQVASNNSPFGPDWNPASGEEYRYWTLEMAPPAGSILGVGEYPDATRFPFQDAGSPGLTFAGNHRGNNQQSGGFSILEAVYDTSGKLTAFAADFTQYDEMQTSWWNIGSVRYNSSVPLPEPSPALFVGLAAGLLCSNRSRSSTALPVSSAAPRAV